VDQTRGPVSFSIAEAPRPTLPQLVPPVRQDLLEEVLPAPRRHRAFCMTESARSSRRPLFSGVPHCRTPDRQISSDLDGH